MGAAVFALAVAATGRGQLYWGGDGDGTDGAWNLTDANWWDGAQAVPWSQGGDAVFRGAGGTVASFVFGPSVSTIEFDAPGYTISGGWLQGGPAGLTVIANADATIDSVLDPSNALTASSLVKAGSGTLTVADTNFFGAVRIAEGEYATAGTSDLFFSDVRDDAILTLGQTSDRVPIGSLSGGGTVRQDARRARTVTVELWGAQDFTGTLQDNGDGKLAVEIFSPNEPAVLLAANTFSGPTTVTAGTLKLGSSGALVNSAVTVRAGSTLMLDSSIGSADRLSDSAPVTLQGGEIELVGGRAAELAGPLILDGGAGKIVNGPPTGVAPATIAFAGLSRQDHGTLSVSGEGVSFTGLANGIGGIVAPFVTMDGGWAVADANGQLSAFGGYSGDINAAAPANVKITAAGTTILTASRTHYTLDIASPGGSAAVLDLGTHDLQLVAGGILSAGGTSAVITNGRLIAGDELVVTNANALTISASIDPSGGSTALTKSGAGTLTLAGTNNYSGPTTINEGTLVVQRDANLGAGTTVQFGGGTLKAAANFTSSKGFGSGSVFGTIDTNGFAVTFAGANTGSLSKVGQGALTLTNGAVGSLSIREGRLSLPAAASGSVDLSGGTLSAAGALSGLSLSADSTLEIGDEAAGSLQVGNFSVEGGNPKLTIHFGIGGDKQDHWIITGFLDLFSLPTGSLVFSFQNLGGLAPGVDYEVMELAGFGPPLDASKFALDPDLVSQGWAATFDAAADAVTVNFSAIPEPAPVALLTLALAAFLLRAFFGGGRKDVRKKPETV